MTTVKDLIAKLQTLPEDLPVIKSADDEGNSYSHLYLDWVGLEAYSEDDGEIEVGVAELTNELREQGYTDEDLKDNLCIVIG